MCYCLKMQTMCACVSPQVATQVSLCSNIIITNLQPLSINYMLPCSFCQPSQHAKQYKEYSVILSAKNQMLE